MSVLEELQKHAGEGSTSDYRFDEGNESQGRMMEMMQASPIPGQSLTQDPEQKMPWETPPEFTDVQDYVDAAFLDISNPETLPKLLEALRYDAPLEYLVEQYLQNDVTKGKITPDLMMLSIEPIMYIMITLSTYAGIDPNFAEDVELDDDEELDEETRDLRLKTNTMLSDADENKDNRITANEFQKPSVAPKSLLARSKEAVDSVKEKY